MKFDFSKSREDFQNKFQLQMDILNKNVLYITHQTDRVLKIVASLHTQMEIERQATGYYQEKIDETSHQTELDEHDGPAPDN